MERDPLISATVNPSANLGKHSLDSPGICMHIYIFLKQRAEKHFRVSLCVVQKTKGIRMQATKPLSQAPLKLLLLLRNPEYPRVYRKFTYSAPFSQPYPTSALKGKHALSSVPLCGFSSLLDFPGLRPFIYCFLKNMLNKL